MMKKVIFDVLSLYYLPQFIPVYRALKAQGVNCRFLAYSNKKGHRIKRIEADLAIEFDIVANVNQAIEFYQIEQPDWVVFGNKFDALKQLPTKSKSALLYHGIGIKDCYYDKELAQMDVRFVEGEYRAEEITRRFPNANVIATGFAKLDPLFQENQVLNSESFLAKLELDPEKKTLLYAPTFYPSSIELFPYEFPENFSEFNIIIKPHFFSVSSEKYLKQKHRLEYWNVSENVYLVPDYEQNILKYMQVADVLISDASSVLFEFAALDKPVVWCDFVKLRWSYRGIFRYRYERRIDQSLRRYYDIAMHVDSYKKLKDSVLKQISNPLELQEKRLAYSKDLIGNLDGSASEKIASYLMENS